MNEVNSLTLRGGFRLRVFMEPLHFFCVDKVLHSGLSTMAPWNYVCVSPPVVPERARGA